MARVSLWALPAAADAAPLATWIERLSAAVGSAPFAPHITVISAPAAPASAVEAALGTVAPFPVALTALSDSDERTRCITVGAQAPPLFTLRAALAATLDAPGEAYEPHLSMVYARLGAAQRRALRSIVTLPLPRTITVDAVALVDTSGGDHDRWAVLRTWNL